MDPKNLPPDETVRLFSLIMRADIGAEDLSFEQSSAKLVAEFGESVRPYLRKAWDAANDLIDKELSDLG